MERTQVILALLLLTVKCDILFDQYSQYPAADDGWEITTWEDSQTAWISADDFVVPLGTVWSLNGMAVFVKSFSEDDQAQLSLAPSLDVKLHATAESTIAGHIDVPGRVLFSWNIVVQDLNLTNTNWTRLDLDLNPSFNITGTGRYWISLSAHVTGDKASFCPKAGRCGMYWQTGIYIPVVGRSMLIYENSPIATWVNGSTMPDDVQNRWLSQSLPPLRSDMAPPFPPNLLFILNGTSARSNEPPISLTRFPQHDQMAYPSAYSVISTIWTNSELTGPFSPNSTLVDFSHISADDFSVPENETWEISFVELYNSADNFSSCSHGKVTFFNSTPITLLKRQTGILPETVIFETDADRFRELDQLSYFNLKNRPVFQGPVTVWISVTMTCNMTDTNTSWQWVTLNSQSAKRQDVGNPAVVMSSSPNFFNASDVNRWLSVYDSPAYGWSLEPAFFNQYNRDFNFAIHGYSPALPPNYFPPSTSTSTSTSTPISTSTSTSTSISPNLLFCLHWFPYADCSFPEQPVMPVNFDMSDMFDILTVPTNFTVVKFPGDLRLSPNSLVSFQVESVSGNLTSPVIEISGTLFAAGNLAIFPPISWNFQQAQEFTVFTFAEFQGNFANVSLVHDEILPDPLPMPSKRQVSRDSCQATGARKGREFRISVKCGETNSENFQENSEEKFSATGLGVGLSLSILLIVAVIVAFLIWRRKKLRKNLETADVELASTRDLYMKDLILKDVNVGKKVGAGNFGEVYQGFWGGTMVALKKLTDSSSEEFMAEISTLADVVHPNIVQYFGMAVVDDRMFIAMEWMPLGCLKDAISDITEITILIDIAKQCSAGMIHLSEKRIIHRDVALRNVLMAKSESGNFLAKIGDFGMARSSASGDYRSEGNVFPIKWCAPEIIEFRQFSVQTDVWAFGIMLWELMSGGQNPYPNMTHQMVVDYIFDGHRMDPPIKCPPHIADVMMQTWAYDAKDRPTFQEIQQVLDNAMLPGKKTTEDF